MKQYFHIVNYLLPQEREVQKFKVFTKDNQILINSDGRWTQNILRTLRFHCFPRDGHQPKHPAINFTRWPLKTWKSAQVEIAKSAKARPKQLAYSIRRSVSSWNKIRHKAQWSDKTSTRNMWELRNQNIRKSMAWNQPESHWNRNKK